MSSLSALSAVLRRLIPWNHQRPLPNLPAELIFQEILPYLCDDHPTSFAGLQVALTCKTFYYALQPNITQLCVDRLVAACSDAWALSIYPVQPLPGVVGRGMSPEQVERKVEAAFMQTFPEPFSPSPSSDSSIDSFDSPIEVSYCIHLGSFDDTTTLWALASLLAKPHVAKHLRKVRISFADNSAVRVYEEGRQLASPTDSWKKAFVSLMNVATECEEVALQLSSVQGGTRSDGPEETLGNPLLAPNLFPRSRLYKLKLDGRSLDVYWHQHLNLLVSQSSHTLTHLDICCFDTPGDKWKVILHNWHLPKLETFKITNTSVPLATLTSFLLANPFISSAMICTAFDSRFPPGTRFPLRQHDFPRFLPRLRSLVATPDVLLALFVPYPAGLAGCDLQLYNLEHVTIVRERAPKFTAPNYDDVKEVLFYAPGSRELGNSKGSRIALRSITIQLPYGELEPIERWLESASPSTRNPPIKAEMFMISTFKSLMGAAARSLLPAPATPDLATVLSSLNEITSFGIRVERQDLILRALFNGGRSMFSFHPYAVAGFVAALPAVKEVVLDGMFGHPLSAVRDADEFWGGLRSLWNESGTLEKLEVRGIREFAHSHTGATRGCYTLRAVVAKMAGKQR
ncbi:hypothetical protein NMY22_g1859 [Coprinellus aureogranulatus]|nr:hypothetical protein NMY22_g1859 [Coprinellus aureogranulatus]